MGTATIWDNLKNEPVVTNVKFENYNPTDWKAWKETLSGKNSSVDANGNLKKWEYNPNDNGFWKSATFFGNVFTSLYNGAKYMVTTPVYKQVEDLG